VAARLPNKPAAQVQELIVTGNREPIFIDEAAG
jgi:hypothetical protein